MATGETERRVDHCKLCLIFENLHVVERKVEESRVYSVFIDVHHIIAIDTGFNLSEARVIT